jgi:hypothetical protein
MSQEALDRFGALLIEKVREETISQWHKLLDGSLKGERAKRLKALLASLGSGGKETFRQLIPEIVDSVLHQLLWMIEQEEDVRLGILVNDKLYPDLREVSDGLSGELYSDRGWIKRFGRKPGADGDNSRR